MLNQFVLVGRIVELPTYEELEDKNKVNKITISIPRGEKNEDGEYECDIISCVLHTELAKNVTKYCLKGDLVGLKGRIQSNTKELKFDDIELKIEKVTFLSSKAKD